MAGATVRVVGLDEAIRKLRELPKRVQGKTIRPALRAAAKLIQQEAKSLAPSDTGQLRRNIKARAGKRARNRISMVVQNKDGDYQGETYYAAFQEFGYRVGPRRLGSGRTAVPGRHFMEQAGKNKARAAIDLVESMMRNGVIAQAKAPAGGGVSAGGVAGGEAGDIFVKEHYNKGRLVKAHFRKRRR